MGARKKIYLTPEGREELREELDELVKVRRPALAERLRKAIAQGDLSENADYKAAKEEQSFLEGRIQEIEATLRNGEIIKETGNSEEVSLGSHVTVVEEGRERAETFRIVGTAEADPMDGKVSHESPIGRALLERQVGDVITVEAPGGEIAFRITAIS
ncbi:MAG: transcription elongation factor GreA [Chloroflexota bacterium]|nr:transcription elongation factor GreA [Chloroflexota bacterium]